MDRRRFLGAGVAAGAAGALSKVGRAADHELVLSRVRALQGGSFKLCDLGINGGRISRIGDAGSLTGGEVLDCKGIFASPGWVDLHVHYVGYRHGKSAGSPIKRLGLEHGVTAMVDAGTTGCRNFSRLERAAGTAAGEECFAFINIIDEGIKISDFYMTRPGWEDISGMERCLADHPDRIVGIKHRADNSVTPRNDRLYYVKKCREAGDALGLPVMIHIGSPPPTVVDILPHLKEGDMITHFLRGPTNSIIDENGKVRNEVKEAQQRGVKFDLGHGAGSFCFNSAEAAMDQGFTDFTVSSDLYIISTNLHGKTFGNVLTNMMVSGMSLEDVIERASTRPARFLGLEREIKEGAEATLSLFSVAEGDFTCIDTGGDKRRSERRVIPEWTIMKGRRVRAGDKDRSLYL